MSVGPMGINGDAGRAVTDPAGHFALKGLASGGYDLVVDAPGVRGRVSESPVKLVRGQTLDVGDVPVRQTPGTGTPR